MNGFEWNKVLAAVLVAGIIASSAGFISDKVVKAKMAEAHGSTEMAASSAAAAPQMPEPVLALIADADIERGKGAAKACAACHTFDKGGADGVGPNLWNIATRGKAAAGGFSYSAGLAAAGGKWTYDDLNHFLWKPKKFVSDTKMNFIGVKKPEDRAALIAWLRTLSDSPPALPSAADIAQEQAALGGGEETETVESTGAVAEPAAEEAPAAH